MKVVKIMCKESYYIGFFFYTTFFNLNNSYFFFKAFETA
ncbi:hypothetical protein ADIAL_0425 [Alkalibacterium sp. AK22]|nr:hypothetical protein ADIAL_0425 [Alkalibacterium sp. AK22]